MLERVKLVVFIVIVLYYMCQVFLLMTFSKIIHTIDNAYANSDSNSYILTNENSSFLMLLIWSFKKAVCVWIKE